MDRVLVTGAGGFVGRSLVQRLSMTYEVHGTVRLAAGLAPPVNWIPVDLAKLDSFDALPPQIDAVVHLAQARSYRDFPARAREIFDVNVRSTARLLEYAHAAGARTFVFASTGGLYSSGAKPFREAQGVDPQRFINADVAGTLDFYFTTKYAAELLVANYQRFFRTAILRMFFVYGAGQRDMLIPNLVGKVLRGEPVTISGDPGIRMNPVHVEDVVAAIERALELPVTGPVNIAGAEITNLTELVELIADVSGKRAVIDHVAANLPGDLVADITQMKTQLGLEPEVTLREGIRAMVAGTAPQ